MCSGIPSVITIPFWFSARRMMSFFFAMLSVCRVRVKNATLLLIFRTITEKTEYQLARPLSVFGGTAVHSLIYNTTLTLNE